MISRKLFIGSLLIFISGLVGGCEIHDFRRSSATLIPMHRLVSQPSVSTSDDPVLLVGLAAHLGRGSTEISSSKELRLVSAGKPLVLTDANGLIHTSREISLAWRKVSLEESKSLARQVIGPFFSYESAQKIVDQLNKEGLNAVVAHPDQWEVWLPLELALPETIKAAIWQESVDSEVKPVLKGRSGEFLLKGPLAIEAPDGLIWKGGKYLGPFNLKADAYGSWTFIEKVPLERYLQGVVPHEIGAGSPQVALEVQAVLARTWAVANKSRFIVDGYNLCSDTQCQVYSDPRQASKRVKKAIFKTSGKILTWNNKPIHAVYHASNGGVMAAGTEAWSMKALPYLQAKLDGGNLWQNSYLLPLNEYAVKSLLQHRVGSYGLNHYLFRWERTYTAEQLKKFLNSIRKTISFPETITVLERGQSGRVIALEIRDNENQSPIVLRLDQIRRVFKGLPSTLFVVNKDNVGNWNFSGGGFGHGAGLSQAGAIDLANRGWTLKEILNHYYPGTFLGSLSESTNSP